MKKIAASLLTILLCTGAWSQEKEWLEIKGKVVSRGKPVPYATLQVKGRSVGVSCNDGGEYELRLAPAHEGDTVVVRSVGYRQSMYPVSRLLRNGNINLSPQSIDLHEVNITDYRDGRKLVNAVVGRIKQNCHQRTAWSTFFFRDWRAVDDELYLFDEAVMHMRRAPYSAYANKQAYILNPNQREMESNYKTLLRHRLLVHDHSLLRLKTKNKLGISQKLEYSDNEIFYDPLSTPQASYALSRLTLRKHVFKPIQIFNADGEDYYLVRSVGPCREPKAEVHYEYIIRKSDLALVSLTSSQQPIRRRAPQSAWVKIHFTRLHIDTDSSSWTYAVRDGRYTLTHYYNLKAYRLTSHGRERDNETQSWRQCVEWTLTDFDTTAPPHTGDPIEVRLQTLSGAFGTSDYSSDFWGHYNTIPIDAMPLRMLKEKLNINPARPDTSLREYSRLDTLQAPSSNVNSLHPVPDYTPAPDTETPTSVSPAVYQSFFYNSHIINRDLSR